MLTTPITLTDGRVLDPASPEAAKALIRSMKRDPLKDACYKLYDATGYSGDPRPSVFGSFYSKDQLQAFAIYMLEGHTSGFKVQADPLPVQPVTQTVQTLNEDIDKILQPDAPVDIERTLIDAQKEPEPLPFPPVDPESVPDFTGESNRPEIEPEPVYSHGSNGNGDGVLDQLRDVFGKLGIKGSEPVDMSKIRAMVEAETKSRFSAHEEYLAKIVREGVPTRVEIIRPDGTLKVVGKQHKTFPLLLKYVGVRVNIALVGPAGGGKTRAAHEAALANEIPFEAISVGPQTTQSQIMGYMDANGRYVDTAFRRRFEHGGLILLDEFDAGNPGVSTCVNGATANEGCGFPDGYVLRHANFVCVCAMNTYGNGASRDYVGRNELDRATKDRFTFIDWDYDEVLEADLCADKEWCNYVQKLRHSLFQLKGIKHIISPRASYDGAKLLAAKVDRKQVIASVIWKGLAQTEIDKIVAGAGL